MSNSSKLVGTYNQLENKSIKLVLDRTPAVDYFCTSASIPGVSSTASRAFSPFADVKLHGDKLVFQPLIVNFIVDENLQNWNEIFEWMKSYGHPEGFDDYQDTSVTPNNLHSSKYSDAKLLISNNKYNTAHEFHFIRVHPIDLSDIAFDVQIESTQSMVATVTFEYDTFSKLPSQA